MGASLPHLVSGMYTAYTRQRPPSAPTFLLTTPHYGHQDAGAKAVYPQYTPEWTPEWKALFYRGRVFLQCFSHSVWYVGRTQRDNTPWASHHVIAIGCLEDV